MRIASTLPGLVVVTAAAAATTLSVSRDASAFGPIGIEVGAKVGAGTNPTADSINPLGFGAGARGGVNLFGIYAGVQFVYYFGGSADSAIEGHRTGRALLYGFEGGYDFNILGLLVLRPQLGIGDYVGHFNPTAPTPSSPRYSAGGKDLYLEPGLTALVPFGFWYVGADANVLFLPGQSGSKAGFTFHGQIGFKL